MKKIKLILLPLLLVGFSAMGMKKTNIVEKTNEGEIKFHEEAINEENPFIGTTKQTGEYKFIIMYFLKEKKWGQLNFFSDSNPPPLSKKKQKKEKKSLKLAFKKEYGDFIKKYNNLIK